MPPLAFEHDALLMTNRALLSQVFKRMLGTMFLNYTNIVHVSKLDVERESIVSVFVVVH